MPEQDIYIKLIEWLGAGSVKLSFGYGLTVNKDWDVERRPYLKIKFFDSKTFDIGLGLTTQLDISALAGVRINKAIKLDLGIATTLAEKFNLKHMDLKWVFGIRFDLKK